MTPMKKLMKNSAGIALLVVLLFLVGCKKDKASDFKMISQGPAGEIMVVVEKDVLRSPLGDSVVALLTSQYPGMGISENPYFKLDTLPHKLFTGYIKRHRNILEINILPNGRNLLGQKDDAFAYSQNYMLLEASNNSEALRLLNENKQRILSYYENGEVSRFTKSYKGDVSKASQEISKKFGFVLSCPDYRIKRTEKDFLWMSKETKRTSHGIVIYTIPYTSREDLAVEALVRTRDSLFKKYVEGPDEGTYMATESKLPVEQEVFDFNGYYAVKLRGYWTLEGGFMGGPFVSYAFVDELNNRIVVLDSYIFAPEERFNRVQFIRETEGIFHTLQMLSTEEK